MRRINIKDLNGDCYYVPSNYCREDIHTSIHPMALQPELGLGLLTYWRFLTLFNALE
jgi:hypothetical protein